MFAFLFGQCTLALTLLIFVTFVADLSTAATSAEESKETAPPPRIETLLKWTKYATQCLETMRQSEKKIITLMTVNEDDLKNEYPKIEKELLDMLNLVCEEVCTLHNILISYRAFYYERLSLEMQYKHKFKISSDEAKQYTQLRSAISKFSSSSENFTSRILAVAHLSKDSTAVQKTHSIDDTAKLVSAINQVAKILNYEDDGWIRLEQSEEIKLFVEEIQKSQTCFQNKIKEIEAILPGQTIKIMNSFTFLINQLLIFHELLKSNEKKELSIERTKQAMK